MSELIEKQAVIDALLAKIDTIDDKPDVVLGMAVAAGMIKDMPSVTPAEKVGRWIPVSERLPKDDERVLVTRRIFHWANEPAEYAVGIESFSGNVNFVAWMPLYSLLPEPYKAESEG